MSACMQTLGETVSAFVQIFDSVIILPQNTIYVSSLRNTGKYTGCISAQPDFPKLSSLMYLLFRQRKTMLPGATSIFILIS